MTTKNLAKSFFRTKCSHHGGAKGLGQAIAWRLASEGAAVTIIDVDDAAIKETVDQFRSQDLQVDG